MLWEIALLFIFSTSHLRPTPYFCHRFVHSHSSWTFKSQEAWIFSLISYYIIHLFWSSLSQTTLQSLKRLAFYFLKLMHQTSQKNPFIIWQFIIELFAKQSNKQVGGTFLPPDILRLSCLPSRIPNRSEKLFYPLILLRFNSKRSTKQVKKDYFTFWHFYGLSLLRKTPNRSRRTLLRYDTFMV